MLERRQQEIDIIRAQYGELEVDPNLGWIVIKHWPLSPGWNKTETSVLVYIPAGYPVTPPDNFYVDNDLNLAGGGVLGNTSRNQVHLGRHWLMFSYHVEASDWKPQADLLKGHNLQTFLIGVAQRLSELN